jgi:hypothetical protein
MLFALSFMSTSVFAYLAVLFAARLPQQRFDWRKNLLGWKWRIGFYNLEDFAYRNWSKINWGTDLELHKSSKHSGRHFPAGSWTIDFLARDKETNDLVVIHLKRGSTSDSTVGQLLRHMSWVKENIAENGQNVRGMVIAKETDAALEYALKDLPSVEIKTYEVGLQLLLKPPTSVLLSNKIQKAEHQDAGLDYKRTETGKNETGKTGSESGGQAKTKSLVSH